MMDFVGFISQVGYPIAVSAYTLVVLRTSLDKNTEALDNIRISIANCPKKVAVT